MFGVGLFPNLVSQRFVQAARTYYEQTGSRPLLSDSRQCIDLKRQIVFFFQQANRNEQRMMISEKGLEFGWELRRAAGMSRKRMRRNQSDVFRGTPSRSKKAAISALTAMIRSKRRNAHAFKL